MRDGVDYKREGIIYQRVGIPRAHSFACNISPETTFILARLCVLGRCAVPEE